jgi:hypothetical protein
MEDRAGSNPRPGHDVVPPAFVTACALALPFLFYGYNSEPSSFKCPRAQFFRETMADFAMSQQQAVRFTPPDPEKHASGFCGQPGSMNTLI